MRKEVDNMAIFRNNATCEEVQEFWSLVKECRKFGFRESRQVTKYIMDNKLGNKYKYIAGGLHMKRDGDRWTYPGGISPEYYGKLCRELNLHKRYSDASVEKFESFAMQNLF